MGMIYKTPEETDEASEKLSRAINVRNLRKELKLVRISRSAVGTIFEMAERMSICIIEPGQKGSRQAYFNYDKAGYNNALHFIGNFSHASQGRQTLTEVSA